ncbi:MAG TPA: prolyl oligopeptidase family serine peptidase [Verrucomicrobiae bacterium]
MKTLIVGISLFISFAFIASAARVPPLGIAIAEKDRAELRSGADALAREIASLRSSPTAELLPDVEIFHKAVDWALRYEEFYRSNELGLARSLLKQGTERARQLREGKPAWLTATGLVVRGYISRIDGSVQPYGLVVPATFRAGDSKAHRLDVWLHGRDNNLTELKFISDRQRSYGEFTPGDTFVLHPYGRYCNAFKFAGEVDVFEAMDHVKQSYRIDNQRIALRGFSMGGAGVWHLAAHHPGVWAVAAPGAGFSETAAYTKALAKDPKPPSWEQKLWQLYDATDYAANFFNLPVVAYNGTDDPQRQAADMMERAMKAEGLTLPRVWGTNVGHKYTPEGKKEVSQFVDEAVAIGKDSFPANLHFSTRTVRYGAGSGVQITAMEQHWQRADVLIRKTTRLEISTTNVTDLFLWSDRKTDLATDILIDGQHVEGGAAFHPEKLTTQEVEFSRRVNPNPVTEPPGWNLAGRYSTELAKAHDGKWFDIRTVGMWPPAGLAKSFGLQGPIDDAFMDSFLVVRPTGRARNEKCAAWSATHLAKATNEWRAQFRGDARVKDDTQISDADIAAHNLVLFGDPQSNRLLARIADKLPIRWSGSAIELRARAFASGTHVLVLIFPNPLNPRRYVVVNSGFTFAGAGSASNARQTPELPDYAVLDVEHGDALVLAGFFDEQWRLR